jgi:hypothetical protein
MKVHVQIPINASKEAIWNTITDIEHAASHVKGIEHVEILERPKQGLVGLKWKETRTMFGKKATETMWITEAEPLKSYTTRAENHGAVYISRLYITEENGMNILHMEFTGIPQHFMARILGVIFGFMMKGATKKMLMKDLVDIKGHVERHG